MPKLTISSSLRYTDLIRKLIADLSNHGIKAVFPNLDSGVKKEDVDLAFMKKLEADHFLAIDDCTALYVICPEGKVGTLVSVEIGYATAKNKPVIFSEVPEDLGLQAMSSIYLALNELEEIKNFINNT